MQKQKLTGKVRLLEQKFRQIVKEQSTFSFPGGNFVAMWGILSVFFFSEEKIQPSWMTRH